MASAATDPRERVALAESDQPATADAHSAEAAPRSLKQRLADIRDECAGIRKDNIKTEKFSFLGHTFEAVLSEVRPLLHRHGVDIEPTLVERTYNGNRCDVLVDFTFERTDDSDEKRVIRWGGAGTDNGDKAFAKAGTNALKEMLKKRFLITDRDDAKEEEEKVEHQTDDAVQRQRLAQESEKRRSAVMKGLNGLKVAIESTADLSDLRRIRRDSRELLDDQDIPDVTRAFFDDLLTDRERELRDAFPGDR